MYVCGIKLCYRFIANPAIGGKVTKAIRGRLALLLIEGRSRESGGICARGGPLRVNRDRSAGHV